MLIKVRMSKATPDRASAYAVSKNIMDEAIKYNLFSNNPLMEMKKLADRFGKWKTMKERKTLSIVFSPNPIDLPTEEQLVEVVNAVVNRFFSSLQGIAVIHKDKHGTLDAEKKNPIMHAHFYASIIDPLTGRNVHLSNSDILEIRRWADNYAHEKFGWKPFSKANGMSKSNCSKKMMGRIENRGKASWYLDLVDKVETAYYDAVSFSDFKNRLSANGINISINDGVIRFETAIGGRDYSVRGNRISPLLSVDSLSNKYTDFNQERRFDNGSQRFYAGKEKQDRMGKANSQGSGAGSRSGAGYVRKLDFSCIICTRDKSICKECTEFYKGRGDNSHGPRLR